MDSSHCRGCGAEIIWTITEGSKWMPLDAKSEKRFVVAVEKLIENDAPVARLVDTYVSHFATCPKADKFRRK